MWGRCGLSGREGCSAERHTATRRLVSSPNWLPSPPPQAYLAGNKALARELGAKGRQAGERMAAAHAAAADQLFERRNAPAVGGASGGGSGVQTVDMHGLHVAEALARLDALVQQLQARRSRRLRVVVGLGQHGNVPARLPAAVRRWLGERGLPFSEPYAGLLEVQL